MAGRNPSALDLRRFHRLEREFFNKLVHQLKQNQERMKWVLALWLWFESIGHHDFIRHVSAYQDDVVLRFVEEGNAILQCLIRKPNPDRGDELPLTTTLVTEPMNLRFFDYHRDVAISGVTHFFENVASIILDDTVMEEIAATDVNHPASKRLMSSGLHIRPIGEGTSSQGASLVGTAAAVAEPVSSVVAAVPTPALQSALNPMAKPWSPVTNQSPVDQRSMFITFSRGYPLSREEIMEFFTSRYGKCVEVVMIERAPLGEPPMYGRVVFTSASMIALVLNGQRTAKFMIKGKHLWARMYVPRQNLA